ncbi:hypothetical protein PR048_014252 [Dryococelus australis]|uniref:RNA-directed DNA polymerase n=1 Tax=Dryococelus australis TaxID=614101 RepID=A0ABQ9HDW3_9NEOP|nr:hypothetical protein PR048_014252 [Dryococelus australis]
MRKESAERKMLSATCDVIAVGARESFLHASKERAKNTASGRTTSRLKASWGQGGVSHIAKACRNKVVNVVEVKEIYSHESAELAEPISVPVVVNSKEQPFLYYHCQCMVVKFRTQWVKLVCMWDVMDRLVVVETEDAPLLGRDLIAALKLVEGSSVNKVCVPPKGLIMELLKEFRELIDGQQSTYKYGKIELKMAFDARPIFFRPRTVPFAFQEKVDLELERLELENIIIRRWGTPLVPVVKVDGNICVCARARADYKVTVNDFLENVLFLALQGGEYFSKIDLSNAYNQLCVTEQTAKLLAWSMHKGIYNMNRLSFGVKPACAILQRHLAGVGAVSFLDDIVVTGATESEHLANLRQIVLKLKEAGFKLNCDTFKFFEEEVQYLGHIIDKEGIRKNPNKIRAFSRPVDEDTVRAFLGIVNYYYRSLYPTCQKSYGACLNGRISVRNLVLSQVLVHFEAYQPVKLTCDASVKGITVVLSHVFSDDIEQFFFASRILSKAESNYSAIQKARSLGENKGIPAMAVGRLQRWDLLFEGKCNVAYGLSRLPLGDEVEVNQVDSVAKEYLHFGEQAIELDANTVRGETEADTILHTVVVYVQNGWPYTVSDELKPYFRNREQLSVEQGILMWGYSVFIPKNCHIRMLEEVHSTHLGRLKLKNLCRSYLWWPTLNSDLEEFIRSCEDCVSARADPSEVGEVKWPESKEVFERIHIKWVEVFPMSSLTTDACIGKLRETFPRNGLSRTIVSDSVLEEFQSFYKVQWYQALGHTANNGTAENVVKTFKAVLSKELQDGVNCHIRMLEEVHSTHLGRLKLKNLCRSYLWWPTLNSDLEEFIRSCEDCVSARADPSEVGEVKWPESKEVFERIHIKWVEVFPMSSLTTDACIGKLRETFPRNGLSRTIVSDSVLEEFQSFYKVQWYQALGVTSLAHCK